MTTLYAQPYDIEAHGFYFDDAQTYKEKASSLRNRYGQPVEEFEIQFIDGERIDAELFEALSIHQANLESFFEKVDDWDEHEKQAIILAAGEWGYSFDLESDNPSSIDIDIYACGSLREFAEEYAAEWMFCDIPERFHFYIDWELVARDLSVDYAEANIAGERVVYRCG